jgi:hypothetical protein
VQPQHFGQPIRSRSAESTSRVRPQ